MSATVSATRAVGKALESLYQIIQAKSFYLSAYYALQNFLRKLTLKIKKGNLVFHKMRKVQLFDHSRVYYPLGPGVVLESCNNHYVIFWKDFGITKEESHYLDLAD